MNADQASAVRLPPAGSTILPPTSLQGPISTSTLYMPIASPPTPAPSPRPEALSFSHDLLALLPPPSSPPSSSSSASSPRLPFDPAHHSRREFAQLLSQGAAARRHYLAALLADCTPAELLFVSAAISPRLKRDFLRELPPELALHVLSFVGDHRTLARAGQVSRAWRRLAADEAAWEHLRATYEFEPDADERRRIREARESEGEEKAQVLRISHRRQFQRAYTAMTNWTHGGRLLRAHRMPLLAPEESGVVTSLALDGEWVVVGLANARVHIFSAHTGVLARTLVGHESGVWAVCLVSRGGAWAGPAGAGEADMDVEEGESVDTEAEADGSADEEVVDDTAGHGSASSNASGLRRARKEQRTSPERSAKARRWRGVPKEGRGKFQFEPLRRGACNADAGEKASDMSFASEGWGQAHALVVSGGCDKELRVWDVKSGYCIHVLRGHNSTIRCIRVLHNRPVAVSGSRDCTLRVWDVRRGRLLRLLEGHEDSVRALDVFGNRVVSGSYDRTCRLWNVDTGECLHVFRGHFHQIYTVAFDGVRVASAGLDTTVRVWDAESGHCVALLQGHTALVCQLQLCPSSELLVTGGSDGRVITFSLATYAVKHRIAAHDSSVTSLQFDGRFLVTGGNDGRVRLFETRTGRYVRELSEPCESVWKVAYRANTLAVTCKRAGKTVTEIWSFEAPDDA